MLCGLSVTDKGTVNYIVSISSKRFSAAVIFKKDYSHTSLYLSVSTVFPCGSLGSLELPPQMLPPSKKVADTGRRMGERNVRSDSTPGWGESYK
ncbi:hypothetical protein TNCV_1889431 [Trichonephila clavipes]|nr:hypothetical protein TNCV_1889431 [Trichonephila clavipes]